MSLSRFRLRVLSLTLLGVASTSVVQAQTPQQLQLSHQLSLQNTQNKTQEEQESKKNQTLNKNDTSNANSINVSTKNPTLDATKSINTIEDNPTQSSFSSESPLSEDLIIIESNLWNRIRNGYAIPNLENHLVTLQTNWYHNRIDYLLRIVQRGSRYLYHVVNELDKRGMPTDLALLPFIESAFNPNALSTAKASGMWQFMPATGRDYNLKQSIFKDDRRGVIDSTDAALDYLQRLYGMFGDWQLALAAYNWGEGSVQRAIKKQQALGLPIDFDSLSALMPLETRNYVPKLQAVKNIIGHPELYGIKLPLLENTPYFSTIKKVKDIDVHLAAKLAELPLAEFKALNPQFNRPVITGSNNTKILLPIENIPLFESNLNNWKGPLSTWTAYTVNKTERVESLASKLGIKPDVLREVNFIPEKMRIKAGSTVLIPKSDKNDEQNIPIKLAEQAQLNLDAGIKTRKLLVKVGKRDSLASLAKQHKVSVADIKTWNNLKKDQLSPGQRLNLEVPIAGKANRKLASNSLKSSNNIASKQIRVTGKSSTKNTVKASKKGKTNLVENKKTQKKRS
jgi:membrane-bound lytic murein transglycosylase D